MKYGGALPSQLIKELITGSFITGTKEENVRPGSLDPSLTLEGYRVKGAFLPGCEETVEQAITRVGGVLLKENSILEKGSCYVFRLATRINRLPDGMYGYCNPKSSSGRIDIHVRLLADKVSRYDYIPEKYFGPLWIMIVPKTFPVIIYDGVTLNQIRFCNQDTRFDELRLELAFKNKGGLIFSQFGAMSEYGDIVHSDKDGSILLTLGLNFPIPGFEAIETREPIELSRTDYYDSESFFRPITLSDHSLVLRDNAFYILSTGEFIRVPEDLACEMRPMDERSGDLRSHYAGFVDPGWGMGADNDGHGRPLTLEVRSFDNGLIICHGQPISKIRFERMLEVPDKHYDQMSPTYGGQFGPRLGKYFKKWK
jgi:dCTP deaminase